MIAMMIETISPNGCILLSTDEQLGEAPFQKNALSITPSPKKDIEPPPLSVKWGLWGTIYNLPLLPSPIEQFQIDDTFFHKGVCSLTEIHLWRCLREISNDAGAGTSYNFFLDI